MKDRGRNCGWIKTATKYVTSCGREGRWHRGFIYCPYCGKVIKISKK